jgi:hypothetical protein
MESESVLNETPLNERVSRREFGRLQGTWRDSISKNVIEFDENGMGFVVEDKQGRVHEFEYRNMNVLKENVREENQLIEQDDFREKLEMAQNQLNFVGYAAEEILEYIEMGGNIEEWYQNKLSKVHSDMESLHSYVEGEMRRTGMKESFKTKVLGKLRNSKI